MKLEDDVSYSLFLPPSWVPAQPIIFGQDELNIENQQWGSDNNNDDGSQKPSPSTRFPMIAPAA